MEDFSLVLGFERFETFFQFFVFRFQLRISRVEFFDGLDEVCGKSGVIYGFHFFRRIVGHDEMGERRLEFLRDDAGGFSIAVLPIEFDSAKFSNGFDAGCGGDVGFVAGVRNPVEGRGGRVARAVEVQSASASGFEAHLPRAQGRAGRPVQPGPFHSARGGVRIGYSHVAVRSVSVDFQVPTGGWGSDSHPSVVLEDHQVLRRSVGTEMVRSRRCGVLPVGIVIHSSVLVGSNASEAAVRIFGIFEGDVRYRSPQVQLVYRSLGRTHPHVPA